jgi:hypothetical protein
VKDKSIKTTEQVENILNSYITNKIDFYNDVIFLIKPLIDRLSASSKPPKVVAINLLSTLSSFVCFSAKNFFIQLLNKNVIDKYTSNTKDDAMEKDQKY